MDFTRFTAHYPPDTQTDAAHRWTHPELANVAGYREFADRAVYSFSGGLYRLHTADSGPVGQRAAENAFPAFARRVTVFGFDWLGRQFAIDSGRSVGGDPQVLLLEPETELALEIPVGFRAFHEDVLVDNHDAALASEFYAEWRHASGSETLLPHSKCVGYVIPLCLGGADAVANLEVTDFEVYWELTTQIVQQVRDLPPGTPITGVHLN